MHQCGWAVFHYVCVLVSECDRERHHTKITQDLNARLAVHDAGKVNCTAKHKP